MQNNAIRFACNGCGVCCKGRLVPLTLNEARQWLARGGEVAVILEAFDESMWPLESQQYAHSAQRAVEVPSGDAQIQVIAVLAGNALVQCPSLGEDNRCGIYEQRPLVCSIYPMEINPFIGLRPQDKICPPDVWERGEVLFSDRIVDPVLADQVQRSRQADRDDAWAKISLCADLGLNIAAWKGNALAVYLPDRVQLHEAIERFDQGAGASIDSHWRVRVDDVQLRHTLHQSGIDTHDTLTGRYIFHPLQAHV
ncbi:YkgJ family cysteine cluster protein [Pseudomonas sp. 3A(2025)]